MPMGLVNFRLFDGLEGIYSAAALETDNDTGRILRLWTSKDSLPPSAGSIDLEGRCVLPGLVDCYVHLTADASADPVAARVNSSEGYLAILAASHANRTLEKGVTTVRDTGAPHFVDLAVKKAIAAGLVEGPRLLSSGKMLTMTGGDGCLVGQEIDGPIEARKYARMNLKMGADNIKMVASGGIMTPHADPRAASLTVEELAAGFEEAKKAGKLSACHAHSLDGVKNAVRAGVRTIEHGVWLDEEACAMMRSADVYLCPTLSVVHNLARHLDDPATLPYVREGYVCRCRPAPELRARLGIGGQDHLWHGRWYAFHPSWGHRRRASPDGRGGCPTGGGAPHRDVAERGGHGAQRRDWLGGDRKEG